jgi:antirestriction protein ArdC
VTADYMVEPGNAHEVAGFTAADEHYSREELAAEIGSWLLALETGIPHDPSQHTAYIASWLEALKKD